MSLLRCHMLRVAEWRTGVNTVSLQWMMNLKQIYSVYSLLICRSQRSSCDAGLNTKKDQSVLIPPQPDVRCQGQSELSSFRLYNKEYKYTKAAWSLSQKTNLWVEDMVRLLEGSRISLWVTCSHWSWTAPGWGHPLYLSCVHTDLRDKRSRLQNNHLSVKAFLLTTRWSK